MSFFFLISINQWLLNQPFSTPSLSYLLCHRKMREVLDMACISYIAIILLFQEYSYCLVLKFWGWLISCLKSHWRTHHTRYSRESSSWVTLSLPRRISKWFLVSSIFKNRLSFPLLVLWQWEILLQARPQEFEFQLSQTQQSPPSGNTITALWGSTLLR